jgi:hypothetical protein
MTTGNHDELAALTGALAPRFDLATVELDDFLHQREPHAQAAPRPLQGPVDLRAVGAAG